MTQEDVPVVLADAHAPVGEHHVPAAIVDRSARARAEEVNQELLLAFDAVFAAMRPEASEQRIGPQPGQQIVRHGGDRVVPPKAVVKRLLLVAHRVPSGSRALRSPPEAPPAPSRGPPDHRLRRSSRSFAPGPRSAPATERVVALGLAAITTPGCSTRSGE